MENKKVNILFWGDAVVETGFARVLHSIAKFLPEKYDICWIGVNYYGDPQPYHQYRIYPAILKGDVYGVNRFADVVGREKPDIIFLLNDAWVLNPMLNAIKDFYKGSTLPKVYTYVPVDAKDHDPDWYANFDIVTKVIAYTEFGKEEIIKACPNVKENIVVIPHGVDNSTFFKMPGTKEDIKKQLYPPRADFYEDSFIVLNANRNQPRKRIDITMQAFKLFSENKPDNVKLYLHMGTTDSHINIQKLAARLGIEPRLIISNFRHGVQTVPIDRLNLIYNATDVGLNTGLGEGWSLTNIEHAVTGAPQVVANHSALRELYYDCGLLVPAPLEFVLDNIMTTGYLVRPEDVAERLEMLYKDRDFCRQLSKKAIQKFTSPIYSWQEIAKTWSNLFEEK
jgi:D-inositol-3-phosphate glycosyltransferase